jgi:4-diphosphocytidyl-2-C-methyl-D-erythritol kinase
MREVGGTAYAKVNFTLDILDRRPDGYHEIRSIMQTITLADRMIITQGKGSPGITLNVDGAESGNVPVDGTNLVCRAVTAALTEAGISAERESIHIELRKTIPSQAGLGGGSSDAATALLLADQLFDLGHSRETLCRLAQRLGSDIPFFLQGGTCRVEGLGEKVTPLDSQLGAASGRKYIVVYKPDVNVPTPHAYRELDRMREVEPAIGSGNATAAWEDSFAKSGELPLSNDFEPVILRLYPEIARVHSLMAKASAECGASVPLLSGSGSALFCVAESEDIARATALALGMAGLTGVHIAHTCRGGIAP